MADKAGRLASAKVEVAAFHTVSRASPTGTSLAIRRVAAGLLALLLAAGCSDHTARRFDSAVWKRADTLATRTRGEMLDDLTRNHPLIGLSRADVLALLGPPTRTDKFREWDLVYVTGPLGMDYEWLVLRLDRAGHVNERKVMSD